MENEADILLPDLFIFWKSLIWDASKWSATYFRYFSVTLNMIYSENKLYKNLDNWSRYILSNLIFQKTVWDSFQNYVENEADILLPDLFIFWKSLIWGESKISATYFRYFSVTLNMTYSENKLYKNLDYWSRYILSNLIFQKTVWD